MNFPEHKGSLYLEHNPHKAISESIEQYLEDNDDLFDDSHISADERAKCLVTGELWTLQWYPDNPVSFHFVAASTFEALMALASE